MKISRPFIHSVLAFAIVMLFVQCNKKNNTTEKSAKTPAAQTTSISGKLPIAYVNIDSLLQKYNYAKDLMNRYYVVLKIHAPMLTRKAAN